MQHAQELVIEEGPVGRRAGEDTGGHRARHAVRRALSIAAWLLVGAVAGGLAGAAWGAQFRGFMRFVSTDPEFSWSGTLFIVGAFTLAGAAHGVVLSGSRQGLSRLTLTPLRVVALVVTLPIMSAAGAPLAPTVVFGALALHRHTWSRWARLVCALVAAAPVAVIAVLTVAELDGIVRPMVATVWLVATYVGIVVALGPTARPLTDGWRLGRTGRIVTGVLVTTTVLVLAVGVTGIAR